MEYQGQSRAGGAGKGRLGSTRASRGTKRALAAVGLPALLVGTTFAAIVATAMPAYADITSGHYTIGSPTAPVNNLAVSPDHAQAGTSTSWRVTFDAPSPLSGAKGQWLSITPSIPLSTAPSKVTLIGGSCLQSGTAGNAGPGTATTSGIVIDLASSCTINAGQKIEVDFDAEAPGSKGALDFTVTTSVDSTPAVSSLVAVGPAGALLSAASQKPGDNTVYTITNVPVDNVSASATSLLLKAVAVSGTGTIKFSSSAGGYAVDYTSSSGTSAADAVDSVVASGATATLTLAGPVANGGTLAITATGTNPVPSGTQDTITVQPGNGTAETTGAVLFGGSVSDVTASLSDFSPGATATYTLGFKAANAVASGGAIYVTEPAGPTDFSTVSEVFVIDNSAHWHFVGAGNGFSKGTAKIVLPHAISAGDSVSVTLVNVTNPGAGTIGDLSVYTSSDPVPAAAPAYMLAVGSNPGVAVSVSPTNTGALASYVISGLKASSAMTGGVSELTIEAPKGTVFPKLASDYTVEDQSNGAGSGPVSVLVSGGGTNKVELRVPKDIGAGNVFSVSVEDTINPSTPSSSYSITVLGAVTGPPPITTTTTTATTTTTTPPTTTTTAPHKPKPKPKPYVTLLSGSAKVHNKRVSVRLHCSTALCSGVLKLWDNGKFLGSSRFRDRPGHSGTPRIYLDNEAFKLLGRARHHTIEAKQYAVVQHGKKASRKLKIVR